MDEFVAGLILTDGLDARDLAELVDSYNDQKRLIGIGQALASERDPDRLVRMILEASMDITGADAGSVFLVEEGPTCCMLRFAWTRTISLHVDYEEFIMPADRNSIAGYVALTGQTLNIADVRDIDSAEPYSFNAAFDKKNGYLTRSMLVVPMRDNKGRVLGVVQLINSKELPGADASTASREIFLYSEHDFLN